MSPPTRHLAKIRKLRRLSKVLDSALTIPGTKFSFGLDPILGLLPGGGDAISSSISVYIVVEAARMGMPREVLGKMVGNILLDFFAGTVPIVGDLFDVGWKSNIKNIELLEKHLEIAVEIAETGKPNPLLIIGLILLLAIIVLGFAAITFFLVKFFGNSIAR